MLHLHFKEQKSCVQGDSVLGWEMCPRLEEEPRNFKFEFYKHQEWITLWLFYVTMTFYLSFSLWLKTSKQPCAYFWWLGRRYIRTYYLSAARKNPGLTHSLKAIGEEGWESGQSIFLTCKRKFWKWEERLACVVTWGPPWLCKCPSKWASRRF